MKSNYRIIKILSQLFKAIYYLSIVNLTIGSILNLFCLFFPAFPIADLNLLDFYGEGWFQADTSYQLLGSDLYQGKVGVELRISEIESNELIYRIFGFFENIIGYLLTFVLFKNVFQSVG